MSYKTYTGQPLTNIVLKEDKLVGVGIPIKPCKRSEKKLGVWVLATRKIMRSHPLERRKKPFFNVGYKLFYSLIFMQRKKTDSLTCFHRVLVTKISIGKSYTKVMPSRLWYNGPAYLLYNACTPKVKRAISRQYADFYVALYCLMRVTNGSFIKFTKSEIIGEASAPPSRAPECLPLP